MATTQDNRLLRIDTPLGADVLLIESFSARESISSPFAIHVDALADDDKKSQVTAEALIGKNAVITVELKDGAKRYFHGMVSRLVSAGRGYDERYARFQLEIVPTLARLLSRTDCRIFQKMTAADIVKQVLGDAHVDFRPALEKPYTERDYCVQYRETDLNFISRLMEDEGIFYFFEHEQGKHTMVLADKPSANKPCPVQSSVHYKDEGGFGEREDTVLEWTVAEQLRSGLATLRDHHFQLPDKKLDCPDPTSISRGDNSNLEIYDYPGDYAKLFNKPDERLGDVEKEGAKIVRLRMEREETAYEEAHGTGDVRVFCSGFWFTLTNHFKGEYNDKWLVTSVYHSASQSPHYVSTGVVGEPYSNSFTCIPYKIPFRPERVALKPVVRGPHTAVVVGQQGEEIWPDKFGRVKVKFFWDRDEKKDENSSCWVRVAQPWAGKNWGFIAIPRIGHEVVVDFLEGDPDQPIIVGSVYNAENMPPYSLPDNKTQTGIKTRSSKGGGSANFNEIRFEDKQDSEELYVHAERNFTGEVEKDESRTVGGSRSTTIQQDDTTEVPKGTSKLVADEVLIDATTHLKITCGGSSIEMTSGMITIKAPMVKIN